MKFQHLQIPSASSNLRDNRVSLREMMRRARDIDSIASNSNTNAPAQEETTFPSYWPSEYELNSGDEDSLTGMKNKLTRLVTLFPPQNTFEFIEEMYSN